MSSNTYRCVENFQSGLKIVWDRFLDGKKMDHVEVVENGDGEENLEDLWKLSWLLERKRDRKRKEN